MLTKELEYIRDRVIDAVQDEFHFYGEDVHNSVTLAEMFADIDMAIASVFDAWHAADIRDVIKDCARAARKAFRRSEFAPYLKEEIIAAGCERLYNCVVGEFENVLEVNRYYEKNFLDESVVTPIKPDAEKYRLMQAQQILDAIQTNEK